MLDVGKVILIQALLESSVEGTLAQGQGIVESILWAHSVERSSLALLVGRSQHVSVSTERTCGCSLTSAVFEQGFDAILAEVACVDVLHALSLAGKDVLHCSCVVP